jgi:hypothetical protein
MLSAYEDMSEEDLLQAMGLVMSAYTRRYGEDNTIGMLKDLLDTLEDEADDD